jgi:hypothetical protein
MTTLFNRLQIQVEIMGGRKRDRQKMPGFVAGGFRKGLQSIVFGTQEIFVQKRGYDEIT